MSTSLSNSGELCFGRRAMGLDWGDANNFPGGISSDSNKAFDLPNLTSESGFSPPVSTLSPRNSAGVFARGASPGLQRIPGPGVYGGSVVLVSVRRGGLKPIAEGASEPLLLRESELSTVSD